MVNAALELPLMQGIRFERRLFHSLFATEDRRIGMHSFQENGPGKAEFVVAGGYDDTTLEAVTGVGAEWKEAVQNSWPVMPALSVALTRITPSSEPTSSVMYGSLSGSVRSTSAMPTDLRWPTAIER